MARSSDVIDGYHVAWSPTSHCDLCTHWHRGHRFLRDCCNSCRPFKFVLDPLTMGVLLPLRLPLSLLMPKRYVG